MNVYLTYNYVIIIALLFGIIGILYERIRFRLKGKVVRAILSEYVYNDLKHAIPVLEFEYGGQSFYMYGESKRKKPKYEVGTEHDIYFIPGYKKNVKIIKDHDDYMAAVLGVIAGIFIAKGTF